MESRKEYSMPAVTLLGIETSCDETSAAVVRREACGRGQILSNVVRRQPDHALHGGVVPEIAARSHVSFLDRVIEEAVAQSGVGFTGLDGVAACAGPGLMGGLAVGLVTGKGIALSLGIELVAVNHLEAHALTARLSNQVGFPYLLILMSGGHTQSLMVGGVGNYQCFGTTLDDAAGEAFDKTARVLGLGWPGGPAVEKAAESGVAERFSLPRPLMGTQGADFSFSGLKTAVRRAADGLDKAGMRDLAAAFQEAVADCLTDRTARAMEMYEAAGGDGRVLVAAGGVAANRRIRARLGEEAAARGYRFVSPPPELCTDNGAMIAWAGAERLALGSTDALNVPVKPRWPLTAGP